MGYISQYFSYTKHITRSEARAAMASLFKSGLILLLTSDEARPIFII